MASILIIVCALGLLGLVAALVSYLQARSRARRIARGEYVEPERERPLPTGGCCGNHLTCEKDSLLAAVSQKIEYFEDEELDRFVGTPAGAYTEEHVEEFRDVLLSLDIEEVSSWVRSLQLRGIDFPETLRPELYLLVGENRDYHAIVGRHDEAPAVV